MTYLPRDIALPVQSTLANRQFHLFGDSTTPGYRDEALRDGIDDGRERWLRALAVRFAPWMVRNSVDFPMDFRRFVEGGDASTLFIDLTARLPEDLKHTVAAVVLIAPGRTTNFTFHAADWLLNVSHRGDVPVEPEIGRLKAMKVLCVFGSDDPASVCRELDRSVAHSIELSGGHHLGGRYGDWRC